MLLLVADGSGPSARLGADVATIPLDVIKKLAGHPLTDIGIKRFLADWEKLKKK